MDSFLNRYRSITVLVVVLMAQLLLLGYQVKSSSDVRLIRVWAVTAVTPAARVLEGVRSSIVNFTDNYFTLRDIRSDAKRMQVDLDKLKLENQFLRAELSTADRAKALSVFQQRTQSRTVAARVIGTGPGSGSNVRFIDRGVEAGVIKGMPVVTPDGIVGKVTAVFPLTSQILLATDGNFAAGVISQKGRFRGTLRGTGYGSCRVEGIPNEAKIEPGEWFFTTGDDRVFPKGMPVGQARTIKAGQQTLEILIDPSGFRSGIEEVLIVLEGAHQQIPETQAADPRIYMAPPPPAEHSTAPVAAPGVEGAAPAPPAGEGRTEADRLRDRYRAVIEAQGATVGNAGKAPDFGAVNGRKPQEKQP